MVASTVKKWQIERKIDRSGPFSVFSPCKKNIIKGKVTLEFKTWSEQYFKGINFYAVYPSRTKCKFITLLFFLLR